jgi:DNA invertase Pin-like site-specific DNA recombinase
LTILTDQTGEKAHVARRKPTPDAPKAILYPRLSRRRQDDLDGGAGRQLHDHLRPLAARLGATVVAELGLKDRSASRYATRIRHQYIEAMAMIDRDQADTIIFYDVSRLTRQPREMEDLIDRVEKTGLTVISATGTIDLSTGEGRLVARGFVAQAAYESDQTSKRVRDFTRERKAQLLPPAGHVYGWADSTTHETDQAYWVAWMVAEILRGESMRGVARKLNEKQVPRKRSKRPWDVTAVQNVIQTPRNYGLIIEHPAKCECAGTGWVALKPGALKPSHTWGDRQQCKAGTPRPGGFPAIVDPDKYQPLLRALATRASRSHRPRRAGLLSGIVHCALCGNPMLKAQTGSGRPVLNCRLQIDTDRCGGGTIDYTTVARAITATVFEWVDGTDLATLVDPAARIDTAAIQGRLDTIAANESKLNDKFWTQEVMSESAFDDQMLKAKHEREALLATLATATSASVLADFAGQPGALAASWEALTPTIQRQIIVEALDLRHQRIVVDPVPAGTPHRNSYNTDDPATVRNELRRLRWEKA